MRRLISVFIFLLFSFFSLKGISQSYKLNFILEIDSISPCTPTDNIDFQLRFEEIPLNVKEQAYPFYSVELQNAFYINQLSLHLFYNERQIVVPPFNLSDFENGHFKITLDTCKKNDCLYIYHNIGAQFSSTDCTIDNIPKLTVEVMNPIIYSADERKFLDELVQDESIPFSKREEFQKTLTLGFTSLEKYYYSLAENKK